MSEDKSEVKSPEGQPDGGLNPKTVKYLQERPKRIESYSDKLRETVEEISRFLAEIKKQSGVTYYSNHVISTDEQAYYDPQDDNYLAVAHGTDIGLCLAYINPNAGRKTRSGHKDFPCSFSRAELINTVKVLPQFLGEYAEELQNQGKEIQEFTERAERIKNILSE